jgi:hypothetical protein
MTASRGRFTPMLIAGVSVAALTACGSSGPSDKDQIAAIIKREGTNPSTLCTHLTSQLLVRLGGKGGCLREASSAAPDPTTRATSIQVGGDTATAVVIDRAGSRTVRLVKDNGAWKVSRVG